MCKPDEADTSTERDPDRLLHSVEESLALFGLRLDATFSAPGSSAEAAFREGLREIVREAGYTVEYFQGQDPAGYINHDPGRSYDLDILMRDGVVSAASFRPEARQRAGELGVGLGIDTSALDG
jgi:hypothetical protein